MRRIDATDWKPVGVESLEDAALAVVRSQCNTIAIAGPGAGKTELLAQRACFLLQTGGCPPPGRILAISFKRDAAKNLADRVRVRCGDLARRFESLTLDAFAKSLVDRFSNAIPEDWRPKSEYEVFLKSPTPAEMRVWLAEEANPEGHELAEVHLWADSKVRRYFERCTHGYPLPYAKDSVPGLERRYGLRWWQSCLNRSVGQPLLSFPMISRLAAFILRCNPKVVAALRTAYTFVFLDEFQDTTLAQYDLVRAAFQYSTSVITAVGDSKQRIMLWAGAMENVFEAFQQDFGATRCDLIRNYRSAPVLVRMQQAIAQAIESGTPVVQAARGPEVDGACHLLEFAHPEQEALALADLISRDIQDLGLHPRQFCVLVRQRTPEMIEHLVRALQSKQIPLRDESKLQDLLAEPVVDILLWILRLTTRRRDADAWASLTSELSGIYGWDSYEDEHSYRAHVEARRLMEQARALLAGPNPPQCRDAVHGAISDLVRAVGEPLLRSAYRQYAQGTFLENTVADLSKVLAPLLESRGSLGLAVDEILGRDMIPAMTIHKSKGLEFHTIVFIGLEDSPWWNFCSQPEEEKRAFFVAFSRAAQRVLFTFSDIRNETWGRRPQYRRSIGDLYDILERAGVPMLDCRQGFPLLLKTPVPSSVS